jgi:phosphohistidine phosphatase SixA
MITRPDRIRAQQTNENVDDIAKENHEVSSQVFERVSSETDIDNMMAYLKGEYEES